MEYKKGFQWFKTLSKKQQKQFRLNCHAKYGIYSFNNSMNKLDSFYGFMFFAFIWSETPQGRNYWSEISNRNN